MSALDEFAFRLLGEVSRLPEIVSAFVQMAKLEQQKHEEVQRQLSVIVASLEAARAQKSRVKEEIKAASSGAGRKEWRMELEKLLGQEGALQQELETLTARLQDDAADARIRKQVTEALGEAGKFILGLSADARDQFLRATLRKVVVNASDAKEVKSSENELRIRSSGEKGRYLLNVQFSESSLASMLSKHCAESSIKLGDWLPG